ncbi:hypothetical protein Tco_0950219 [Tanacetum coccineum]
MSDRTSWCILVSLLEKRKLKMLCKITKRKLEKYGRKSGVLKFPHHESCWSLWLFFQKISKASVIKGSRAGEPQPGSYTERHVLYNGEVIPQFVSTDVNSRVLTYQHRKAMLAGYTCRNFICTVIEVRGEWIVDIAPHYYDLVNFPQCEAKRVLETLYKKREKDKEESKDE